MHHRSLTHWLATVSRIPQAMGRLAQAGRPASLADFRVSENTNPHQAAVLSKFAQAANPLQEQPRQVEATAMETGLGLGRPFSHASGLPETSTGGQVWPQPDRSLSAARGDSPAVGLPDFAELKRPETATGHVPWPVGHPFGPPAQAWDFRPASEGAPPSAGIGKDSRISPADVLMETQEQLAKQEPSTSTGPHTYSASHSSAQPLPFFPCFS